MEGARIVTTIETLVIESQVVLRCTTTNHTLYGWDESTVDNNNKQFLPFITLANNIDKITIKPKKLSVGHHYIRLRAEMRGEEGTVGYDYGFIRIVLPELVPKISGPNSFVKGSGSLVLKAGDSFDPDLIGPSRHEGLNYTWFCRRENENFPNVTSFYVEVPSETSRDKGGCFGFGSGHLSSTTKELTLDPAKMKAKLHYVIELVVSKGQRTSRTAAHRVYIISALQFSIK